MCSLRVFSFLESETPNIMAQEIRKMPVRSREINLNSDFEGWQFTARTNMPLGVLEDLVSGDYGKIRSALAGVVLGWNFVDENGKELPDPAAIRQKTYKDEAGEELSYEETQGKREDELLALMRRLSIDLAIAMARALNRAVWELPPN